MSARLGQACRHRREHAGLRQIDIATEAEVVAQTISHFEKGAWWARDTDRIVEAYARLLDMPPEELWRAALEREDP